MPHDPIDPVLLSDDASLLQRVKNARRASHYKALFLDDDGQPSIASQKVLADLNRFCRGNQSTYQSDPRAHALLEGRREVLLRLLNFLGVPSHELAKYVEVQDE